MADEAEKSRIGELWRKLQIYVPFDLNTFVNTFTSLPQKLIKNFLQPLLQLSPLRLITSPPKNLPRLRVAGLENLGNTCFLNAMLQALASLPSMVRYLSQISQQQTHLRWQRTFIQQLSKCLDG
jgi:ubiquitin C-terminal hydrolase